jgi:hypothetical protein
MRARIAARAEPGESTPCDPGTCPGTFSFTYGIVSAAAPRDGGSESNKAGFAFNVYATKRIAVEVDNDNIVALKPATGDFSSGIGDTTFYAGVDAMLESDHHPALSILYGVKVPTASASKGIGSGEVDHTLLVALSKGIGRTSVELDLGDAFVGRTTAKGFDQAPFAAWLVSQRLDEKGGHRLHAEIDTDFATSVTDMDIYTLGYLESAIGDNLALRIGGRFGITSNVSRAAFYFGLKFAGMFAH